VNYRESSENYLETILVLSKRGRGRPIHSSDVAEALSYARPSVSVALKKLRASGHLTVDADSHIILTKSGREIAESMYERHTLISDWLVSLGVDRKNAANDACRMEHVLSEQSFAALKKHVASQTRRAVKPAKKQTRGR
jgi:Mn-dependent DtxR family transcriptional regulator